MAKKVIKKGKKKTKSSSPKSKSSSSVKTNNGKGSRETEVSKANRKIRSPIVTVLGHIDHGKTTLLDYIRGTVVQQREAAGITQHIGASFFPMEKILDFCNAPPQLREKIKLPGLLVIDTPGHTAFMNLRKRGGAVADIAILVIEVPTGPMQTTWEAVRILRGKKVPFVIAANKIDRIDGWKPHPNADFLETYKDQPPFTKELLDKYLYETIGLFYEEGFQGIERYDRVNDFTKNVAIVPTSAKTGEGIPSLLMVLVGLIQQFLMPKIKYTDGAAKGVVLEVKKETGYGLTLDCIIFDGHLKKGQTIVLGGLSGPVVTHVRALLTPKEMDEIRDPSNRFDQNEMIYAAAGVKILAPNIEDVIAGAPLRGVDDEDELDKAVQEIKEELETVTVNTDDDGIILKADTLGSLEAAAGLFRLEGIPIRKAEVGPITKKDIMAAVAAREVNEEFGQICGFNVKVLPDAQNEAANQNIPIFVSPVVYQVVESYKEYREKRHNEEVIQAFNEIIKPGKISILPQYIFRRSNPLVCGVKVEGGTIIPKQKLVNKEGKIVGTLHSITLNNKPISKATKDEEVAISISGGVMGRNVKETDQLYLRIPESHARLLRTKFRNELSPDTLEVLIEYIQIMRKVEGPYWAL